MKTMEVFIGSFGFKLLSSHSPLSLSPHQAKERSLAMHVARDQDWGSAAPKPGDQGFKTPADPRSGCDPRQVAVALEQAGQTLPDISLASEPHSGRR